MTFRNIEKILKADNWVLTRVCGSHYQYRKVGVPYPIVIPNHNGKDLTIGVIKDLEKKTGLTLRR
jgi:predicted RNA binding protein YcfA (HicA-like mRNA interferase family)